MRLGEMPKWRRAMVCVDEKTACHQHVMIPSLIGEVVYPLGYINA
jgi:hypothetical protein